MSYSVTALLREIPPFHNAIAQSGDVSLRCVSKDFKTTFDAGICRAWINLKYQSSKNLNLLAIFMDNIENLNHSASTPQNSLLFFQQLKNSLKCTKLVLNPVDRLPTDIDCFQLAGPKYVKDKIPQEIWEKSIKINQLIQKIESFRNSIKIPEEFECPVMMEIMTIPIFDSSHPYIQRLWDTVKDGTCTSIEASFDWSHFHITDMTAFNNNNISNTCSICRHPTQKENLQINAVLQNEILLFLKNQVASLYKEAFIHCDVGVGNTLGFRSQTDWSSTAPLRWTAQGWTGFLPVDAEFKLVKTKDSDLAWEKREQNRFIPKEMKETTLHLDGISFCI